MRQMPRVSIALMTAVAASLAGMQVARAASGDENGFASRINSERSRRGIAALAWNEDLAGVARRHAQRMADENSLYHNPNLRDEVDGWETIGENVGYGPNVAELHQAFMDSAGHRANILDRDYTQIGVGAVWRGEQLWVAEVFMRPMRTSSTPPRRTSAAPRTPAVRTPPALRPVPAPAPVRAAASPPASAAPELTRLMVRNVLAAQDPAIGAIHPADLFASAADAARDGLVVLSFRPFARIAGDVNRRIVADALGGR